MRFAFGEALASYSTAILLLIGLALRLGYGFTHVPAELPRMDGYVDLATSFAQSGSLMLEGKLSAWREPGYPILLGLAFKAFGRSYATFLALNSLLSTAGLWFLFLVGRRLFGRGVALAALAVAAAYPPFLFYAAQPLRESCLLAVSGLALWSLCAAFRSERPAAFAAAGAANALAALTHMVFLPFALFLVPASFLWLRRKERGAAARWSGAYLAAFLALYALWPLRNFLVFQRFIPGSSLDVGSILYVNMIVPQEVGGTAAEVEILARDPVFQEAQRLPDAERAGFLRAAAVERVRRDPLGFARLFAWRFFWDEWRVAPRPRAYAHSYAVLKWVSLLTDGWIVPLGLLGLLLAFGRPPEVLWVYLFIASLDAVYSLVLTMLRYRLPIMPWLILFAVFALSRARERWAGRRA